MPARLVVHVPALCRSTCIGSDCRPHELDPPRCVPLTQPAPGGAQCGDCAGEALHVTGTMAACSSACCLPALPREAQPAPLAAQVGAFVPATFASLTPCDRLLSRIGTGDSLETCSSSFMVEMQVGSGHQYQGPCCFCCAETALLQQLHNRMEHAALHATLQPSFTAPCPAHSWVAPQCVRGSDPRLCHAMPVCLPGPPASASLACPCLTSGGRLHPGPRHTSLPGAD